MSPERGAGRPPTARTLPQLLRDCAAEAPDDPALVAGTTRLSYAELADRTAAAAAALAGLGVGAGDCVALLAPNIAEWIPIALGAQSLGARVDAFNTWVKAYDLDHLLSASGADVLVMVDAVRSADLTAELATLLPELAGAAPGGWRSPRYPSLRHVVVLGRDVPTGAHRWDELLRRADRAAPHAPGTEQGCTDRGRADATGESVAFVLYTSGSTRNPKAVPLMHRLLIENGWHIGERLGLGPQDRVWFASPLFWSFGCANALMATLTHRACFVLQEQFEPHAAAELMRTERVTAAYLLPAMTEALAATVAPEISALELLRTGVTIGRPDEVERAAIGLGITGICNVYGATENYGNCCVTDHRQPLQERLTTQGRPLPGVEVRVVDPATGAVLPAATPGELQVRGRVTTGYLGDPEATAAAFTADGWYRTGDRMLVDADGSVTYLSRLTDMIKTSGINVSPAEVEGFLMTHPLVAEAVVLGAPHPTRDQVVVAFVVAREPGLTDRDVIDFCRRHIAGYKVPWAVAVVPVIPTTVTGKVARRQLVDAATSLVAGTRTEEATP